jgi:hypothetical protein
MLTLRVLNNFFFWKELIFYVKLSKMKFFFLENSNIYLLLPEYLFLKKSNNQFSFFFFDAFSDNFNIFFDIFLRTFKSFVKINCSKIFFSGLGFRVSFLSENVLSLKLGFSHLVFLKIPKGLDVILIKNNIYVRSFNSSLLGSFVNTIKNLRFPDSYKGKGFWLRSEKKKLKLMKKS